FRRNRKALVSIRRTEKSMSPVKRKAKYLRSIRINSASSQKLRQADARGRLHFFRMARAHTSLARTAATLAFSTQRHTNYCQKSNCQQARCQWAPQSPRMEKSFMCRQAVETPLPSSI